MKQTATRAKALILLQDFTPRMGRRYANGRNFDHGPGGHDAVSQLSPFVRRRLVLESEVVGAAIAAHGPEEAEKFVQEVIWRGYFKGWLERRPQVWVSYRDGLIADLSVLETDRRMRRAVMDAEAGNTGISCFDAWVQELVETGYLHNHARMWFASIWIFTLGLPWRIGADFFFRHLLDGDPASNTLGWRWVAGLHTRGKAYKAQAWNIATFTANRFTPHAGDLADNVQGLDHLEPDGLPPILPLRAINQPQMGKPTALLITEDDCRVEDFDLATFEIRARATLHASHLRSPRPVSDAVVAFEAAALVDAALRAGGVSEPTHAGVPSDLATWAQRAGASQIVTPYLPIGPLRDWLDDATPALTAKGITVCEWQRDWDMAIWPHSTAGFFKVKQQIPRILDQVLA
jgi:deoxyribodipyrimidine photo-lyase